MRGERERMYDGRIYSSRNDGKKYIRVEGEGANETGCWKRRSAHVRRENKQREYMQAVMRERRKDMWEGKKEGGRKGKEAGLMWI